jgi:phosphoglycolate phosphatase-like HAD superfamily hydrolase
MTTKIQSSLEYVLFDWDGTLLDSFEADANAYMNMFGALGMRWSIAELKLHYSPNWHRVYRAARLPRAKWVEADRLWRFFYRKQQPKLQPGAMRVLRMLDRRFKLALVSSGSRSRVRKQLREHNVSAMFLAKVCSEDAPRRKPHPAPLRMALEKLRAPPLASVYIEMAHRAGVRAIGVLGGSPVPERLRAAAPDALIETIRDLPALLKSF